MARPTLPVHAVEGMSLMEMPNALVERANGVTGLERERVMVYGLERRARGAARYSWRLEAA